MLIKEIKEIIKQTFFLLGVLFVYLVILYPLQLRSDAEFSFFEYFQIFYQIFIFVFSFFMGISLFSYEIRNGGFEYMLTFPVSRTKILLTKIIPRLAMLIMLYLGYLILLGLSATEPFVIPPDLFNSLYFSLFFISTSFSVLRGNFVANSLLTMFMFTIFILAGNTVAWFVITKYFGGVGFKMSIFVTGIGSPLAKNSINILSVFLALPFVVSLFYGFKRYDIRISGKYAKRFFLMFIPMILIGMLVSYFILDSSVKTPYSTHYITRDGIVIKHTYRGTSVVCGAVKRELPDFFPYPGNFYEREDSVYLLTWNWKDDPTGNIVKFETDFSKFKIIYTPPEGLNPGLKLYGFLNTIVFLEHKGGKYSGNKTKENQIVFLETKSGEIKRVKFPFDSFNLIGVAETYNRRVWIGYYIVREGVTVYTIDGSGNTKNILRSTNTPLFINNELITFNKNNLIFGRFTNSGYEEFKRIDLKGRVIFPFYLNTSDLNTKAMKYLYGKVRKRINYDPEVEKDPIEFISIDLNNYDLKRFKNGSMKRGFLFYIFTGDTVFEKFNDNGDIELDSIFKMDGQNMILLKNFKEQGKLVRKDFRHIGSGFMTGKGEDRKFYKYPDLKEIKPRK